jgi:hypothetical protein
MGACCSKPKSEPKRPIDQNSKNELNLSINSIPPHHSDKQSTDIEPRIAVVNANIVAPQPAQTSKLLQSAEVSVLEDHALATSIQTATSQPNQNKGPVIFKDEAPAKISAEVSVLVNHSPSSSIQAVATSQPSHNKGPVIFKDEAPAKIVFTDVPPVSVQSTRGWIGNHDAISLQVLEWLGNRHLGELLFHTKQSGFSNSVFHQRCDLKGPTLTLVYLKNGYCFGGFVEGSWNSGNGAPFSDSGTNSLLFCFPPISSAFVLPVKRGDELTDNPSPSISNVNAKHSSAIDGMYNHSDWGPCFGWCDLVLNLDNPALCCSYIGATYDLVPQVGQEASSSCFEVSRRSLLAGVENWGPLLSEVAVVAVKVTTAP